VKAIEQRPSKAKSGSHDDLVGGFFNGIDPLQSSPSIVFALRKFVG